MASRSRKEVISSWLILRLTFRSASSRCTPRLADRVSALGAEPVDPRKLADLVERIGMELEMESVSAEASPMLRMLKNAFHPDASEKERRTLQKSFGTYQRQWDSWRAAEE